MEQKNIIIAIDGYSACGKSTVAKALARETQFLYIDSGAMYRAVTVYFIDNNVDLKKTEQIQELLDNLHIDLRYFDDKTVVHLNGKDITERIREVAVSRYVPSVSAIKNVRDKLTEIQREMGKNISIIMDGRDIGTTVFPNADVKVFMTADPQVRAIRRLKELSSKTPTITLEEVLADLLNRDSEDIRREVSPLMVATGAFILDNTKLSETQQKNLIMAKIRECQN